MSRLLTAAAALADEFNAHVVLCGDDKKPYHEDGLYQWKDRPMAPGVIDAHPHMCGVVPWSILATVLDADHGDPAQLSLLNPLLVDLPTRRGRHFYFNDTEPRKNAKFEAFGCLGDVRGADGYAVLHYDGADRLLDALRGRAVDWRSDALMEPDFWERITLRPDAVKITATVRTYHPGDIRPIEEATQGCRWRSLRAHMGEIIRRTNRPRPYFGGPIIVPEWRQLVEGLVLEAHARMPKPRLSMAETLRLADILQSWYASGGKRDHSPESQSWRGRRSHGGGRPSLGAPWEAEGVSRATWFRRRREA